MREKIERWESVEEVRDPLWGGGADSSVTSAKIKVPGGWLYRTVVKTSTQHGAGVAVSMQFVADPA